MGKECSDSNVTLQMREEIVSHLQNETKWLQSMVEERHPNAIVAFTHNDLCTANILLHESTNNNLDDNSLCIIDYEYGSINYIMYDVANFFCELCGGNDDGIPNRELFPSEERQRAFLNEYIRERRKVLKANGEVDAVDENEDEVISELQSQIQLFQMASNLIWGVWGILQACGEVNHDTLHTRDAKLRLDGEIGLESFDNLRYGKNRLANYLFCKESMNVS
jgi:thiamine kinase-like enzyme